MNKDYINWWQGLSGPERFAIMKKYDILKINDKPLKRMWQKEILAGECKCIRFVGADEWHTNGCKLHPKI